MREKRNDNAQLYINIKERKKENVCHIIVKIITVFKIHSLILFTFFNLYSTLSNLIEKAKTNRKCNRGTNKFSRFFLEFGALL